MNREKILFRIILLSVYISRDLVDNEQRNRIVLRINSRFQANARRRPWPLVTANNIARIINTYLYTQRYAVNVKIIQYIHRQDNFGILVHYVCCFDHEYYSDHALNRSNSLFEFSQHRQSLRSVVWNSIINWFEIPSLTGIKWWLLKVYFEKSWDVADIITLTWQSFDVFFVYSSFEERKVVFFRQCSSSWEQTLKSLFLLVSVYWQTLMHVVASFRRSALISCLSLLCAGGVWSGVFKQTGF